MSDLLRPEPLPIPAELIRIDGNARYRQVEEWLTQGRPVCITDTYGTALTLYSWLKRNLQRRRPVVDYRTSRLYRELLWQLTRPLLVEVAQHRLHLKRAPTIPWLAELYPELDSFLLPLPAVLGLNGAWQWYVRGVTYPVLEHPLHPFYGVHFTTRSEHLELFAGYLRQQTALPGTALDVGAGAGPLSLLMLQHGVRQVVATDTNPNALHGLRQDLVRQGLLERVQLHQADLVPPGPPLELIAFNPPWIPGEQHALVDVGSHHAPDLFERFFAGAAARLRREGRLVMLFSNLAQIAELTSVHPVAAEIERGGRFRLVCREERPAAPVRGRGAPDWQRQLRSRERIELWVLAPR